MPNDLIEDENLDLNEDDTVDESPESLEETPQKMAKPEVDPELLRKAEEKERKRWQIEAADGQIREASLRAWEKERLADAEGREARLAPFDNRDPFEYRLDGRVPRVAPPKEKALRAMSPVRTRWTMRR